MKEKRIIRIDDIDLCVRTDESSENIDEIADRLNRSMRLIHTHSKNCSKVEAALICAMDYCSEALRCRREYDQLLSEYNKLKEETNQRS